jgi:hypothetical protein
MFGFGVVASSSDSGAIDSAVGSVSIIQRGNYSNSRFNIQLVWFPDYAFFGD